MNIIIRDKTRRILFNTRLLQPPFYFIPATDPNLKGANEMLYFLLKKEAKKNKVVQLRYLRQTKVLFSTNSVTICVSHFFHAAKKNLVCMYVNSLCFCYWGFVLWSLSRFWYCKPLQAHKKKAFYNNKVEWKWSNKQADFFYSLKTPKKNPPYYC